MNKQTIRINSTEQYTVTTGISILNEIRTYFRTNEAQKAIFIVDANVLKLQNSFVQDLRGLFKEAPVMELPAGESSKDFRTWKKIVNFCLKQGVDRSAPMIAVGGGVTGDVAGFAAASVMRGLPLIHIPTTLLAMVDSSIGGKTGINHKTGKNLIGSFYQPDAVFADLSVLSTLPEEEFICGFGEVLKYGAIADTAILDVLKTKEIIDLRSNLAQLDSLIQRCIKVKAAIVSRDNRESNERMHLNYGHTFAHALEKLLGYGKISHGQAVYTGMIAAGYLSELHGANLNHDLILRHVASMQINHQLEKISSSHLKQAMISDKKKQGSSLRFVMLQQYGRPYVDTLSDPELLDQSWKKTVEFLDRSN